MEDAFDKLLSFVNSHGTALPNITANISDWGALGKELETLLRIRNGFYAYESSLFVRPTQGDFPNLGIHEWNQNQTWKYQYNKDLSEILCFAEDIFGNQYGISKNTVILFDSETGECETIASSIEEWAREILSHSNHRTGHSLSHEWQMANGRIKPGTRLVPKIPFVCGGKFEASNLFSISDVKGMLFRGSIFNQIKNIPDGAEIVITVPKIE